MAKKKIKYVWVIAYIDSEYIATTSEQLSRYKTYRKVTPFIPTVRILKKTFKNKNEFEDVPLLFNYGFFRMPKKYLKNPEFFVQMQKDIPVIYQWVKDMAGTITVKIGSTAKEKEKRKKSRKKAKKVKHYLTYALATNKEIKALKKEASKVSIFDHNDLHNIDKGSHIILKGYPWEDMEALVKHIDRKKEEVTVELVMDDFCKEVKVSFHNVFYSIYQGDHKVEGLREVHLEDLKYKNNRMADRNQIED